MKLSENQALSEHKSWNHKISLIKKVTSEKLSIYQLSLKELQELRDYLNSNLWKKYIQHFTSKAEYSVIFILKKNDKWWLYINYQKLNAITQKNRYSLSLIEKLQKRLKEVKWFMKLNIQEKYYKIYIKKSKE